jgi:regulation of enolase protein 1 (concanavalin A-like superfamily)
MKKNNCPAPIKKLIVPSLVIVGFLSGCLTASAQTVPAISGISPNGNVQFQSAAVLSFNASSSTTIDPSGISVQLTGTLLTGQSIATTYTTANGLNVSGSTTSRTVSAPLASNVTYTAVMNVTNSGGQSASATVSFDTINPAYTFEAEDFDYASAGNSRLFFDNPQINAYRNLNASEGVDAHNNNFGSGGNAYRPSGLNTEVVGDKPRSAYTTGQQDYDVGWNDGGSGKWGNYSRTFPAGAYNIYMRAANPNSSGVTSGAAGMSLVTNGWGTANQMTTDLGTFSIPGTGNWQAYTWVPLLDANGNLAQFTGGGVKTLRVTTLNGGYNANCYLLIPADVSVPVITNLYPNGTNFFQYTNQLSFVAASSAGISPGSIVVVLDGINVSNLLSVTGSSTNWSVSCPLALNTNHTATITVTARNGKVAFASSSFNDFQPTNYQFEAEDYDYTGSGISGLYFDNPQTNAYSGLPSAAGIDNRQTDLGANPFLYRPNSPAPSTTAAGDGQRPQFAGKTDYNIGFFGGSSWANYTRHYPVGTYYVWGRFAEGASATETTLSQLTGGYGSSFQTSNFLGAFLIPNTGGWATWVWSQLVDANGNLLKVHFDGSQQTLQLGGSPIGGQSEVNVNFLMLVPVAPDLFTATRAINDGTETVQILFSKPVELVSATNIANYVFDHGISVTATALSVDNLTVTLTTSALTYGTNYTVVINNVRDRMNLPNTIATNTTITFQALPYTLQDIGNPPAFSSAVVVSNGLNMTAVGNDTGGTNDQGGVSYKIVTGDFDVAVRVAGVDLSDVFAKAGLMARENLSASARFAASLTTPAMNGSFFSWRDPIGSSASSTGNFPANYPNTWLRLKRSGNTFSGFAGYDGQAWQQVGTATIGMPSQIYLGYSVSSHGTNQLTTAQFRDISNVTTATSSVQKNPHERIGPSSRKTPIVFSEIMSKPADRLDGKNLEFAEIYNSNPWFQDISGYQITCADMHYTFPPNTTIPGGAYFVIAASPSDMANVYGITNVFGPYTGSLKKAEELTLIDERNAVLLTVPYDDVSPWPIGANGEGHSIVLANPTYGESDPRAWDISDVVGGSPGQMESFRPSPLRNVVINEYLAHTDPPDYDYVELYNHSSNSVDISGCILTDDAATNKFIIPPGTILSAGGFISFSETTMGFGLDAAGEAIYLINPDRTRILDAVQFDAQQNGVASGRWPDGAKDFYRLSAKTPGASNAPILVSDVVINELMYNPISGDDNDQYIELFNRSTKTVNLSGWQLTNGITFTVPTNTTLASGGYLVIARSKAQLLTKYANLNNANTLGDFSGKLSHGGEHVALTMPALHKTTDKNGNPVTNIINIVVNDLTYGTGGRWGNWSDGGGSSLELIDPNSDNRLAPNWADSDESAKSSWTNIEVTGVLDNGANYDSSGIGYAQLGLLDEGECLVDNVEVNYNSVNNVSNPTFESGTNGWVFQGCFSRSSLENEGYGGSGHSLHLRTTDSIWTGDNSCQVALNNTSLQAGQTATLRFKARWLHGWPEALLRLNGNWLEATGALPVPSNLGTPGMPNSRLVVKAGPAIYNVTHSPSLPATGEVVVVTANAHDVSGVQGLTLFYRLDPSMNYAAVAMRDDGTGGDAIAGDGVFSATIPGQSIGTLVAFYLSATNNAGTSTRFPALVNDNAPVRECLVMFGDTDYTGGSFGAYHFWISQTNANRWASLGNLSNEDHDGTMVNGSRVIYDAQARFAGSPYHQNFDTPYGNPCHYKWTFQDDDKFLGATSFNKIHQPGNYAGDDPSLQREQLANTLLRNLGVPSLNRRYMVVYVNGHRRGDLMEDAQTPDKDMIDEYFSSDTGGYLFKVQPWFEFAPQLSGATLNFANQSWATLNNYTTTGGAKKTARYRYNYLTKRTPTSASDYSKVFALVDAASTAGTAGFVTNMENVADMENWMRVFAANHAAGNWDVFGAQTGQNLYGYAGVQGTKFSLMMFDFNIVFGNQGFSWNPGENLFNINGGDPNLVAVFNAPTFRRMYWRALGELVGGPLDVANSGPLLDAKHKVFSGNGLNTEDPNTSIKGWLTQARSSIASQLAVENATTFSVNPPVSVTNGTAQFSGVAPVNAQSIWINGVRYDATWTTVTNWTVIASLPAGTNQISIVGVDSHGNEIPGQTNYVWVTNNVAPPPPALPAVLINEWMADSAHTLTNPLGGKYDDWFEIYNPTTNTVDLGGYYLTDTLSNPFQFMVPTNGQYTVGPRRFLLVWADNKGTQNATNLADLHVNFALSKSGEALGLFAPNGTTIDAITFGAQTTDVSQGRYPDGGTNIVFMTLPTPRTNNVYNTAPVLNVITNAVLTLGQTLTFTATATDVDVPAQTLKFTLGAGAPTGAIISTNGNFNWTPPIAPTTNTITIVVTDNGTPVASASRNFIVTVWPKPQLGAVSTVGGGQVILGWQTVLGQNYQLEYKNDLNAATWVSIGGVILGTGGWLTVTNDATLSSRQFYRLRVQ